jgi:hypothetical protein
MPTSDGRGSEQAAKWIPFLVLAALGLAASNSCSPSSTADGADASPTQDAADAASHLDSASSRCTSITTDQGTVVCTEPVACGGDGGDLPPCTWAAALAFVCPIVLIPGEIYTMGYSVATCNGGLNEWAVSGVDTSFSAYYSATTGQIVASIGAGSGPGLNVQCQAPCDFVIPMPQTTSSNGDCTVDSSLCRDFAEAGVVDAATDGHAEDVQTMDAARDASTE